MPAARRATPLPRSDASRRRVILAGLALGAAAAASGASIAGTTKAAQRTVNYQASPKGNARCDRCQFYVPPADCKVVSGPIVPSGACDLFAPRP